MAVEGEGGAGERMDRERRSRPGRGGTGTADPVDADPAHAGDHPDAETLPLARPTQAPSSARPPRHGTLPAQAPTSTRPPPHGTLPAADGARSSAPGRRPFPSGLARQLGLFTCYLAAGIAVTWPRVTYLGGSLP